jgi:anti-sigma regulatory factor (Ser/Thr protein kinase)
VHEKLSHAPEEIVDFDGIADRVAMMAGEVSSPEVRVTPKITGQFGMLPSVVATPLAMVLTELLQNALQHGFGTSSPSADGMIEVVAARAPEQLTVTVTDSGAGLPPGFDLENATSLGLQIVRTLVEGELGGRLILSDRPGGGTVATIDLPVRYEPMPRPSLVFGYGRSPGGPDTRTRILRPGHCGLVRCARLDGRAGAQPNGPALERASLVLAQATPDAGVLAAVNSPAQALVKHAAPSADLLGLFNLQERRAAVSDREEELGIGLATGGDVAPVHAVHSFSA